MKDEAVLVESGSAHAPNALSDRDIVSLAPATGIEIWRGAPGDVGAETRTACEAWGGWASRSLAFRAELIRRFANAVRARATPFTELLAAETGKPLWEARLEIDAVIALAESTITAHGERTAQRRLDGPMSARTALRHKPHGVLAVITPYTQPVQLPAGHILPALLAGNAIVFKPSEKAPACGRLLVDCLVTAGLPEGVVRFLPGDAATGRALAADTNIDGVLFTGSSAVGIELHRRFAGRPDKLLVLEMGGNNPIIAWNPPDPYVTAVLIAQSAFLSAGQRCTAARRLIVPDGNHEPLVDALCRLAGRLIVAAPDASPAPFMGPMINNDAADRVQEEFLGLMLKGGRAIAQLHRPDADKPFLSPAIIDMTQVANRPDAELFGPVLQIVRVPDLDAAIAEANATRFGLCASLLGGSPEMYDRFWSSARAGTVNWNRATTGDLPGAPLGGTGLSGNHRPTGLYAADYSAYPVVSAETEIARASIGIGLRDD